MPTQKLTAKTIENIKPPRSGRLELWDRAISADTNLSGTFGLRVTANGSKSWVVMYRIDGKQRRQTIGSFPAYSLSKARGKAREALMLAGQGIDPVEAKKQEKRRVSDIKTVKQAVDDFIKRHAKRHNRSWREVERVFKAYVLPKWEDRPLPSITPADVHEVLDGIMDAGHGYMANRTFAHLRKFFNWCAGRHWISEVPTAVMKPPAKEEARDRILDKEEIKEFWERCEALGWPFGPCLKLLLITGQRRNEVARMKWEHLDLEEGLWTLPKEATKMDRLHEVPLSPMAVEILKGASHNGKFVFSTTGKTPISGFSRAKARLDKDSKLTGWRLHDLRRTAASGMAEIGMAPHVIEKVLNHATGQISGVAAVYNRHLYQREKQDALHAWARALESIIHPGKNNVIEIREHVDREE